MRLVRSLVMVVVGGVVGTACAEPSAAPTLKAPSKADADRMARSWLDSIMARDYGSAAAMLCSGDKGRVEAVGVVAAYAVDHVEPAWVGAEPYFRVDVTLEREQRPGERRSLAIRARDGCIERTGGAPIGGAAPPEPGELSL